MQTPVGDWTERYSRVSRWLWSLRGINLIEANVNSITVHAAAEHLDAILEAMEQTGSTREGFALKVVPDVPGQAPEVQQPTSRFSARKRRDGSG